MLDRFKNSLTLLIATLLTICTLGTIAMAIEENDYRPEHSWGSDDSDWWTAYPDKNINSGSAVNHLDWVLEALEDKPLLIMLHSNNCQACLIQTPRINDAVQTHKNDIIYYDILAEGSGYQKALDILSVYNPTGKKQYIPTTIFVTLIENSDGEVEVGWHGEVDIMSADEIKGYIEDSIYYHKQNAANWEQ